jgi:hypothetical protein
MVALLPVYGPCGLAVLSIDYPWRCTAKHDERDEMIITIPSTSHSSLRIEVASN